MENVQFSDILHLVVDLNYTQLKKLRHQVERQISVDQVGKAIADREASIASCPHCDSLELSKWGSTPQGRQRYRCKSCNKTFNSMAGTALYRLRKPEKWGSYSEHMWLSCTLREAAKKLNVNLKTAFKWRHRLLKTPCQHKASELVGIIEADETFINESFKGKKVMPREPRKRGGGNIKKVPVLIALDRNGSVTHHVLERDTKEELSKALTPLLSTDSVLCTDGNLSYQSIVKNLNIKIEHKRLIALDNTHVIDGVYHIQTLNNYMMRWKKWLKRFNGVGTEYLDNYLAWFRFMEEKKQEGSKCWLREAL
jgi:transposase-like protein